MAGSNRPILVYRMGFAVSWPVNMVGKWILIFGVLLVLVGAAIWLAETFGLPLGRLPGDIRMRGEGWSFSFPIVTSITVSIVLTVLLNLFLWFRR
jgi:hypothetical protein